MPASIEPMKATLAERVPRGDEWLFEVKWDGVRAIAFVDNEEVRLQARSGLRCERQYPELGGAAASRGGVARDSGRRNRGARQQGRLAVPPDSAAHRQQRPEHDRAPGAFHAGGLFRVRPALPGWLRLAQRGAGEAARIVGTGADAGQLRADLRRVPGRGRGAAGGGAGERPGGHHRQARAQLLRIAAQPRVAEDQDRDASRSS